MRKETRNVYVWIIRLLLFSAIAGALVVAEAQTQAEVKQIIKEVADEYQLDRSLLLGIAFTESSFNPRARGSIGERGLYQLRPEYFGADASDCPRTNARAAAEHLIWLRKRPACKKLGKYHYLCHNIGATAARKISLTEARKHPYTKKVEAARSSFVQAQSLAHQ
jgi:hypothetical protein